MDMFALKQDSRGNELSVVLIAPDSDRRRVLVKAVAGTSAHVARELSSYLSVNELPQLAEVECDVIIVDLDADVEQALGLIENICRVNVTVTVMASSGATESSLLIRAMRAGAREFLTDPILPATIIDGFVRASARIQTRTREKAPGRLLAFTGAKGGTGVTMLATNFAIALTKESGAKVALVDLDLQLGEVAIGLGMQPQFSVVDALKNASRLDSDFLSTLLTKHSSGLSVLASPDEYTTCRPLDQGADKLLRLLRSEFAFVVVDAGSCPNCVQDALFNVADTIYLVTEVNLPALRNANRMLAHFSSKQSERGLEVVLNRFNSRKVEIDEESTTKALARAVNWKIPNDYMAVRGAQNLGIPIVAADTPISRAVAQMARAACGKSLKPKANSLPEGKEETKWKFWTSNSTRPLCTER